MEPANKPLTEMTFDELVPTESQYLTKTDAGEAGLLVTVRGFTREELEADGNKELKTILHFVEDLKPMVLNKTNANLLAFITGARVAGEAVGAKIVVYNDPTVSFGGRITGGLRIRKPDARDGVQQPPISDHYKAELSTGMTPDRGHMSRAAASETYTEEELEHLAPARDAPF